MVRSGPGRRGALGLTVLADDHARARSPFRAATGGAAPAQRRVPGPACWAARAVWMPWKRPSSQPTSCAWAIRSSASEGVPSAGKGRRDPFQLLDEFRREAVFEFLDGALVDAGQPDPRRVVERGGLHFVQELLHHGADPHHLRGFVNEVLEPAGPGGPCGRRGLDAVPLAPRCAGLPAAPAAGPGRLPAVVAGRQGVQGGALTGVPAGGLSVVRIAHGFILSRAPEPRRRTAAGRTHQTRERRNKRRDTRRQNGRGRRRALMCPAAPSWRLRRSAETGQQHRPCGLAS